MNDGSEAPSSPVSSTIFGPENRDLKKPSPVQPPDARNASPHTQIAHALRLIGHGLIEISNALTGAPISASSVIYDAARSVTDPSVTADALGRPWLKAPTVGEERTVREVINDFLTAKAKVQKSDRYLRQARYILASFAKGRALRLITEMTAQDASDWIYGAKLEPPTMRRHLAQLRTVARWAMRKGYLAVDFTLPVELPADLTGQRAPEITSCGEVKKLLQVAFGIDPDAGRHWAIRYFAGIRRAELLKLNEEHVNVETGYIEVPAAIAKTRRRRLVKIEANLAAWLACGGKLRPIDPDYLSKVRDHAEIKYTDNAPRKSFISYHVAMWENAARTAIQAGTSEAMVFKNYNQGAVTKEMAKEFWAIAPEGKIAKVRTFKRKRTAR